MALEPLPKNQWTPVQAAHLLNRAGFGGSPAEVEEFYQLGHAGAVERLLNGDGSTASFPDPAWANAFSARHRDGTDPMEMRALDEESRQARRRLYNRRERARLLDLRAWWLYRMRFSTFPLQEKMTLFFHGHFATGYEKVDNAYAMFLQNQTFRRHATGNWRELVEAITIDPAMLIYLDGIQNTKAAPNENYAREVMELFTLGEGHYTETDIREAARAFTGWRFDRRGFTMVYEKQRHDFGRKSFMGRKGDFDANQIIGIILTQPQAARWIVEKLWTFFAYENPEPAVINTLSDLLRKNKYEIKPVLAHMFSSRAFYGQRAMRTQVKSPVQWLVSAMRYLEAPMPEPFVSQNLLASLGQSLFDPPNVKGWDGGVTWITTASLAQRYESASRFVVDKFGQRARVRMEDSRAELQAEAKRIGMDIVLPDEDTAWMKKNSGPYLDWNLLLPEESRGSKKEMCSQLIWRMFQSNLREKDWAVFEQFFSELPPVSEWNDKTRATALEAITNTPHFQLT